ncbi:hypothetical protein LCI18_006147 [Fusarium solani-melongenae]|uniref:Uncharacterized protein n=1 Tax=Fusarium solani subsp. cucurbitae TaxID=2747967 RepID=A0ACD3Z279_FUSSC|nr:hypothetical protein LCI18_006147 [Fusarium solani-melongenae]
MGSSVFHPFPRLPTELRLQIWQSACLPSQRQRRGLHYFNLDQDKKLVSFGWNQITSLELQGSASQAGRSAYLWHGGLWTACKESRAVVMKHSQLKEWGDLLEGAKRQDERTGNHDRMYAMSNWVVGDERVPPGMIVMREANEECYFIVYPTRDMFCVNADNWEPVLQSWSRWDVYYSLPAASCVLPYLDMRNIAFEFNLSWNHDFPDYIWALMREKSARGFLARMVDEMAGPWELRWNIWLVDKTARWRLAESDHVIGSVFHDCDDEYVQIGVFDTYYDPDKGESGSPVTDFILKFGRLGDDYYRDVERGGWSPELDELLERPNYRAESSIKLLARRDNQVTDEEYF